MKFQPKYNIDDCIGKKFNYLTVVGVSDTLAKDGSIQWKFQCDCGNIIERPPSRVIGKDCHSKSCGCMRYKNITHKEHDRSNLQKVDACKYIGMKRNSLTVVGYERPKEKGRLKLKCLCDCGKETFVLPYQFMNDSIKSCGCARVKNVGESGFSRNTLYGEWSQMIRRCYNPDSYGYGRYGDRGITVCDDWRESPENFYKWVDSVGGKPKGKTLDRIDNDGPYSPDNCKWSTQKEQNRNRSNNIMIEYNGKTQCLTDWAIELGMNDETLRGRLNRGWSIEKALTVPVKKYNKVK